MAKNPFPGMNPWFERRWRDAHTSLVVYLRDALQDRLPSGLTAIAEEEVRIGEGDQERLLRPDLQVEEDDGRLHDGPRASSEALPPVVGSAAWPVLLDDDDATGRWLEIREEDEAGRLVTALELLSPSNKVGPEGRATHRLRRQRFLAAKASVVEIDLLRVGETLTPDSVRAELQRRCAMYSVCVWRHTHPGRFEFYPIGLRERLPAVRVPLRPTDSDVALELQPAVDLCHDRGRYERLDYRELPPPPWAVDDATWVDERLRAAGYRGELAQLKPGCP